MTRGLDARWNLPGPEGAVSLAWAGKARRTLSDRGERRSEGWPEARHEDLVGLVNSLAVPFMQREPGGGGELSAAEGKT